LILVVDPGGVPLKVPAWMVSPRAERFAIAAEATIAPAALLELGDLLSASLARVSKDG
jgi:hypothetical protein